VLIFYVALVVVEFFKSIFAIKAGASR